MGKKLTLKCFSPPVMIVTFVVEVVLAMYVAWRHKLSVAARLSVAILLCLALFQWAEYMICEGALGVDSLSWSKIGHVAITALPPLGFHLATVLASERRRQAVNAAYVTGGIFAIFFAFSGQGITAQACLGNYVIFQSAPAAAYWYGLYYYGWLLLGLVYCWQAARRLSGRQAAALRALAIGYLSFMAPTTAANIIDPRTMAGVPSIMCGFAVILAIVLAGEVLPKLYGTRSISDYIPWRRGNNVRQKHTA